MNTLLHKQRIKSIILFIFEILIVSGLFVASALFELDYYFLIAIGLCLAIICFNTIFYWFSSRTIENLKLRTELKSADVIGTDIQEAYNFGKIGLAVTDGNKNVIWINEFLTDMDFDVVDCKIDEISSDLLKLSSSDYEEETVKIIYKKHNYEVKFIESANLYIFKDITDYESIFNYSKNQAPVVGYILFDNFQDVSSAKKETSFNDLTSASRKLVTEYLKKYKALTKRLRADMYMFICSMENYEEMQKDNFSIVDKVRDLEEDGFTLSVGIAYGFPDYTKLGELASNAIDVALSRGGDQSVIAPFSENMIFIGGKTESKASRNKVKIRTLSQSLITLMQHSSNVLVMGHIYADMDAIGAALGVKALADFAKVECKIIYDDQLVENKTRRALKTLYSTDEFKSMTIGFKAANEYINENTLVVAVDFNNPSQAMNKNIITEKTKLAVIDHHRRADNFFPSVLINGIDSSASSASELIAEYIAFNPSTIALNDKAATMMLAGILLDTNYYRNKTNIGTYEASTILKQHGANNEAADDFLKQDYEEYVLINRIMSNASTPFYGVLVCTADDEDIIDRTILAIAAREAVSIRGVNASFVIGRSSEKSIRISARSDGTVNCQFLMEKLNGGGHFNAAASEFQNETITSVYEKLIHILDEYLQDARKTTNSK